MGWGLAGAFEELMAASETMMIAGEEAVITAGEIKSYLMPSFPSVKTVSIIILCEIFPKCKCNYRNYSFSLLYSSHCASLC